MQHLQSQNYLQTKKFKESAKYLKVGNDESPKYRKSDLSIKIKNIEFYRSIKTRFKK